MLIWLVCLWLCAILSLSNLQITLAPCILATYILHNRILCVA